MAFPGGSIPADIILPEWEEIDYAANGYPFTDATYAGSFPIRKAAKLSIKPRDRKDVNQEGWNDLFDVLIDAELYGNSLKVLQTMYLLWRNGPNNIRCKDETGKWFNFVKNASGLIATGTATGSVLLSNMFTFEVGDAERSIKSKWAGAMYRDEMNWLYTNSGSGAAGGVSGAAISGMQHVHYDPADYAAPGLLDVLINDGTNNFSLGELEAGTKFVLDFHTQGHTQTRHQEIPGWVDIKGEVVMWQSAFDELAYLFGNQNKDVTTTFVLPPAEGETANMEIICVNSVMPSHEYDADETKNLVKVAFDGRVRGSSNIVFNSGANSLTLTRAGYV